MVEKRQLNDEEKKRVLEEHGRRCFVDGEPIDEEDPIEFHHIKPFSKGGLTAMDNVAPVCKKHHLTIGTMSLQEYRDKLELEHFFEGDPKYLDDVIQSKKSLCGKDFKYETKGNLIKMYFKDGQPEYGLRLFTARPGGEIPIHSHFYVQTMYIVSGQFECWRFDPETDELAQTVVCGPGDSIYVPSMEPHGMRNISEKESGAFLCCICNVYDDKHI